MSNLESRIAEWRARMIQSLPQRDEAVAELEEHLREHFDNLQCEGKTENEAFAIAQERIGVPSMIAREFSRMGGGWRPGSVVLPVFALILGVCWFWYLWRGSKWPVTALVVISSATSVIGYFGVLGSAMIAISAMLRTVRRPLNERERVAVRQRLATLAKIAGGFVFIGWFLGTMRLHTSSFVNQSFISIHHLQAMGVVISLALLNYTLSRPDTSDRARWITAICPCLVDYVLRRGLFSRDADASIIWVCVVFILTQIVLVPPRFRIFTNQQHEPLR